MDAVYQALQGDGFRLAEGSSRGGGWHPGWPAHRRLRTHALLKPCLVTDVIALIVAYAEDRVLVMTSEAETQACVYDPTEHTVTRRRLWNVAHGRAVPVRDLLTKLEGRRITLLRHASDYMVGLDADSFEVFHGQLPEEFKLSDSRAGIVSQVSQDDITQPLLLWCVSIQLDHYQLSLLSNGHWREFEWPHRSQPFPVEWNALCHGHTLHLLNAPRYCTFDLISHRWQVRADLCMGRKRRRQFGLVACANGDLIVCGGVGDPDRDSARAAFDDDWWFHLALARDIALSSCLRYEAKYDAWKRIAPMLTRVSSCHAISMDDRVFVWDRKNAYRHPTQEYHVPTDTWRFVDAIPSPYWNADPLYVQAVTL